MNITEAEYRRQLESSFDNGSRAALEVVQKFIAELLTKLDEEATEGDDR